MMSIRLQVVMSKEELARYKEVASREQLTLSEWVRRCLRRAVKSRQGPRPEQKIRALEEALQLHYPTGDIDQMLREIEQGRDLR